MPELQCVVSQGGPILVIPSDLASRWRGVLPPLDVALPEGWTWGQGGIVCDYDRACDDMNDRVTIDDSFSVWTVPVGDGRALVLDGELSTAAVPYQDGIVLLRTPPMATVEQAQQAIAAVEPTSWAASSHDLEVRGGRLFVFDSAATGAPASAEIDAEGGVLDVTLKPGRHHVSYAALPYPGGGSYLLIRLSPA